jgi:hypothetical protein
MQAFSRIVALLLVSPACLQAAAAATACSANPEARRLDYWLGDWSVAPPGAPAQGHSRVHLSLDKCLLIESWGSDASDHQGENALAYNSEDHKWYGLFVDNRGRVHAMHGVVAQNLAEFQGPALDGDGTAILKRVRLTREDGKVEQIWEKSLDKGTTWVTEYTMEYSRKRP